MPLSSFPAPPPAVDSIIRGTLEHEGGIVDDPDDPGGYTAFGISERYFPEARDIKTVDDAIRVYYHRIWLVHKLDRLPAWLQPIVFDMVVNPGPMPAIVILQRAIGAKPDGKIGPLTATRAYAVTLRKAAILRELVTERLVYYVARIAGNPRKLKFARGWIRRALSFLP
jgi:lysozyme family protein